MARINAHIKTLKPSATLAINERVKSLRARGSSIYHFGFGQSPFPVHSKIIQALQDHAANNSYLPSLGLPELRRQIGAYLKHYHALDYDPELIFIGPGSKELLFQTVMIIDHTFLIPQGSWVSYLPQIKAKGGKYSILETYFEDNYKLQADSLEHYCSDHGDEKFVLILNSPNNPSGAVYSRTELEALAQVCRKYGIIVLSDEIYSRVCFVEPAAPSMAEFYKEGTILYSGLSKIFSAGGYRFGFMALPDALKSLRPIFQSLFSETFSAVASPVQYAAITAFVTDPELEVAIADNTSILNTIGRYVYERLSAKHIKCTEPMGGFYMLIDLGMYQEALKAFGLNTSEAIAMHVLDRYKVALLPGTDFYFDPDRPVFRLAYVDFNGANVPENWKEIPTETLVQEVAPNMVKGVDELIRFCSELSKTIPLKAK